MQAPATKILVVDDEPDLESLIRLRFRKQIRAGDYVFAFARDGVEALERLDLDPGIDIVLTDLNMPRMDGLTLLSKLSGLDRLLKAVVVSAYGDLQNIRTAMNRGAFDFLTKPIELEDLEITINKSRDTVEQQKKAAKVRAMFGRYVSDEVVAALLERPGAFELGGEKRKVTLLMSDLRGFATLSERLAPEKVVDVLNLYLGKMAEIIGRYGGTINEFIGDAILVLFGAPIGGDDDALRAVACAVDMQLAMAEVNEAIRSTGLPPLEMGIGINTGEVVVGTIGSLRRAKYGVVGSHVNLTSRIESFTVGGQVFISEHTLREAGPAVQLSEEILVSTKGFTRPVTIYAVEAVGEPYSLFLPVQEQHMAVLDRPLPFHFTLLDGKYMTDADFEGELLRISTQGALVRTARPMERFENLKIMLPSPSDPAVVVGDLYAKVVEHPQGETVRIRFTAVPQEVAGTIRALSEGRGGGEGAPPGIPTHS